MAGVAGGEDRFDDAVQRCRVGAGEEGDGVAGAGLVALEADVVAQGVAEAGLEEGGVVAGLALVGVDPDAGGRRGRQQGSDQKRKEEDDPLHGMILMIRCGTLETAL